MLLLQTFFHEVQQSMADFGQSCNLCSSAQIKEGLAKLIDVQPFQLPPPPIIDAFQVWKGELQRLRIF